MIEEKNTYRYYLKQDGKVVYAGFTYDPVRREAEHQKDYPGSQMVQIGRLTTRKSAQRWLERWEKLHGKS